MASKTPGVRTSAEVEPRDPTGSDGSNSGQCEGTLWVNSVALTCWILVDDQPPSSSVWKQVASKGDGDSSYGELFEDNPAGTLLDLEPESIWYQWISTNAGDTIGGNLVTADTANDHLKIGSEGAGVYFISAACSNDVSSSASIEMAIFVNDALNTEGIHSMDTKGTAQDMSQTVVGFMDLAVGDEVDLRFKTESNNIQLDLFCVNLNIHRVSGINEGTGGSGSPYSYAATASTWTPSGGIFYADIAHGLNSNDVFVHTYLVGDGKTIGVEDVERINVNTVRIWVATEEDVRVLVMLSPTLNVLSSTASAWTPSGGIYYSDVVHSFATNDVMVQAFVLADGKNAMVEDIERTDTNTVRIWSATNSESLRVLIFEVT